MEKLLAAVGELFLLIQKAVNIHRNKRGTTAAVAKNTTTPLVSACAAIPLSLCSASALQAAVAIAAKCSSCSVAASAARRKIARALHLVIF